MPKKKKSPRKKAPTTIHVMNIGVGLIAAQQIIPDSINLFASGGALKDVWANFTREIMDISLEEAVWFALILIVGLAVASGIRKATAYKMGLWAGGIGVAI